MTAFLFQRRGPGLFPIDERGEELIAKVPDYDRVAIDIKRSRNARQLALYWSVVHALYEQQERYSSPEALSDAFKICAGLFSSFVLPTGEVVRVPGSISFAKMNQYSFDAFWQRFIKVVCEKVLPRMDETAVRTILDMVGVR